MGPETMALVNPPLSCVWCTVAKREYNGGSALARDRGAGADTTGLDFESIEFFLSRRKRFMNSRYGGGSERGLL